MITTGILRVPLQKRLLRNRIRENKEDNREDKVDNKEENREDNLKSKEDKDKEMQEHKVTDKKDKVGKGVVIEVQKTMAIIHTLNLPRVTLLPQAPALRAPPR